MAFLTSLAGRISATENTGLIRSSIPLVDPIKGVAIGLSVASVKVLHGNDDGTGIKYTDISTAVNDFTANDVPLFDTTNPNNDRLCIALAEADDVEHIFILLGLAGVYSGQLQVATQYKRATDNVWVTSAYVNADFTSIGLKEIVADVKYSDIAFTDDLINPAGAVAMKCVYVLFRGVTGVTTAPRASRLWIHRKHTATKVHTDYTPLVQGTYTGTATLQILPHDQDMFLFGFAKPFAKMNVVITRPHAGAWQTEIVYLKADGSVAVLPTANILSIPSALSGGDELWTRPAGTYIDVIIPPTDWGLTTVDGTAGYYLGWRYTADSITPELIQQVKIQAQIFDTTALGMSTGETATYTKFEANCVEVSPSATTLLIANDTTGKSITVTIPANQNTAENVISLPVTPTAQLLIQTLVSHPLITPADLLIKIS